MSQTFTSDIVNLNVGGSRFSTSRQTLSLTPDSFFTSMLSGRIPTCRDETGALFIDRDPKLFSIILHFLRTKELDLNGVDISVLRHEAEFYGVTPLVKRLMLCEDLDRSLCGDVLFTGFIHAPQIPISSMSSAASSSSNANNSSTVSAAAATASRASSNVNQSPASSQSASSMPVPASVASTTTTQPMPNASGMGKPLSLNNNNNSAFKPGNVLRLSSTTNPPVSAVDATTTTPSKAASNSSSVAGVSGQQQHSRNGSLDLVNLNNKTHSRKSSYEAASLAHLHHASKQYQQHSRNQSMELKQIKTDLGILLTNNYVSQRNLKEINAQVQVNIIAGHHNWIAVAYPHFVCCYKLKDGIGWQMMFQSAYIEEEIDRVAINSKHQLTANSANTNLTSLFNSVNVNTSPASNNIASPNSSAASTLNSSSSNSNSGTNLSGMANPSLLAGGGGGAGGSQGQQSIESNSKLCALLAIAFESSVRLWLVYDENNTHLIGNFCLNAPIDSLFFIGSQLVTTSSVGKIGVWNSLSQLWQTQDITPITSFDTAGSFLLLGGQNGVLYYVDMQKFPLRMKDNDLLVTELYKDPSADAITALSVYLTPKTSNTGNWIEIAYGTSSGQVRVIVQHPETVGHGPQLFQTFSVHRGSVIKVMLTEKYLVSVCSEYNHVRTWSVTRFRGMISTQPGSTPLASFKIVTIDALDSPASYTSGNDIGPFGDRENHQVFVQKVVPYTDQLFVRLSSTGKRICTIKSVDYSTITSFCVHECEGPSRLNSRPRRYLFTGHSNGTIQLWDLTTALELKPSDQTFLGGPSASEFVRLLDQCDLATNSGYSTPTTTNCLSPCTCTGSNNGGGVGVGGGGLYSSFNSKIPSKTLLGNTSNHSNSQLSSASIDENII